MKDTIRIVDEFLDYPYVVRNNAIREGFTDQEFQGSTYHTVNMNIPPEIKQGIENVYGQQIEILVAAFRQGKKNSPIHNLVHADNSCAQMAAVLYLNKPEDCSGGTAFWRHKKTGWRHMPTVDELSKKGYTEQLFGETWHQSDEWEIDSLCGMVFNRIVFYPTTIFHSRYPWTGFGDSDSNARLICAIFFNFV